MLHLVWLEESHVKASRQREKVQKTTNIWRCVNQLMAIEGEGGSVWVEI
jgi:hypothetical protein